MEPINSTNDDPSNGHDNITGTDSDDVINALAGDDIVFAGGGNDTIKGNSGSDSLYGGAGNDYIEGNNGLDYLDGGSGIDIVSYSPTNTPVDVNLVTGVVKARNTNSGTERIQNFEKVIGGGGDDKLTGDVKANGLKGGKGDDTLIGGGGDDTLIGGTQYDKDVLTGGKGSDTFVLGDSNGAFYYQTSGYARITDFQSGTDKIRLYGSSSDYTVEYDKNWFGGPARDTVIFYKGDEIAVLQDTTNITAADINWV